MASNSGSAGLRDPPALVGRNDPGSDRTLGPTTRHQKFTLDTSHRLDFTGYGTVTYGNVGPSGPFL